MFNTSLSNKIALIATLILFVAVVSYGWMITRHQETVMINLKENELAAVAHGLAVAVNPYLQKNDISTIENLLLSSTNYPDIKKTCVINAKGYIQSEVAQDEQNNVYPTYVYKKIPLPDTNEKRIEYKEQHIIVWQPISHAGNLLGWIRIYSSLDSLTILHDELWKASAVIGITVSLISFFLLYSFISRKLVNIRSASEFARVLPEKLGAQLIYKENSEEISNLISALNWASENLKQQKSKLEKSHDDLERKVLERTEELQASTRLAIKASKAKSEFLSSMSHEFRTPLNAILGFSQLLQIDKDLPLSDKQLQSVEHIKSAGEHLLQLVNGILDLAQIETGKLKLHPGEIDTHDLINEVISLVTPLLAEKQLSLTFNAKSNPRLRINSDKLRLTQVLINLVSNAIKYNKVQGSITITTELCADNMIKIMICDTGIGIADAERQRIFSAFERVSYELVSGTGIGLYVCKRLVEILGGNIDYDSKLQEGTCFWIIIGDYKVTV